jgi:hypothetical protein
MVGTLRFAHPTIPEDLRRGVSAVIASAAKQSIVPQAVKWIASSLRSSQ